MSGTGRLSYRDISGEIVRRIAERVWEPGALIPGEQALSAEFGCSRATVNRALQDLARAGVLERRRKAGTRVSLNPVREARFVIPLVRQEIEDGHLAGPRYKAAGPEITVTGGLGDERKLHMHAESFGAIADGPDEIRRVVRTCIREGVDNIKINISGDESGSYYLEIKNGTVTTHEGTAPAADVTIDTPADVWKQIATGDVNGAVAARAVVSQRVNPGMVMMYHSQEKIINTPGSEITGVRGGIHNSVTRIVLKPTHMIGGYAQLSYGFNYYGTIGTNRDEFVVVRKMRKVDWLDTPRDDHLAPVYQAQGENP